MPELSIGTDRGDYIESVAWNLPTDHPHRVARRAGRFCFVGGAGSFDAQGRLLGNGDALGQVDCAMTNLAASLAAQGCELDDVVRLKVYFRTTSDTSDIGWKVLTTLRSYFETAPAPVISMQPVAMLPWDGQELQLQAVAVRGWRSQEPVRVVQAPLLDDEPEIAYTVGLLAGGFFSVTDLPPTSDRGHESSHAETTAVMDRLESIMGALDVSWEDAIKEEGYFLGTSMEEWEPLAAERSRRFPQGNAVATVVPWHAPWPPSITTKVELMGYRSQFGDYSKPVSRSDSWPEWVWDWSIPAPFRQGLLVDGAIWVGGQPPFGAGRHWNLQAPGDLFRQTDFVLGLIGDILGGFNKRLDDLALLVCYFASDGSQAATEAFLNRIAENIPGQLPPITLVPQPMMHFTDLKLEVWGIAR